MRQITIDFEKMSISGLIDNKYAGYLGEHNATELFVVKPADLIGVQYSLAFMTNGEIVHSKYFSDNEPIKVSMWQQITQDSTVYVQLEAYDENGDYLGKSSVARLSLGNSVHGVDVIADSDNPDVYAEIALNSWFRETLEDNADTLDKLSTSEDGKLLFDGKSVGSTSGEGIFDELYEEIKENTENRHWHDNKYTLDKFTASTTSVRPMYGGENVAMKRDIPISVSQSDFNNYLNNDYDKSKIPNWKNHISIENVDQLIKHLYEKFATKDVVSALGNPLTVSVVEVLPETGEANVVYLVPNSDGTHNEYLFVDGVAELIGSTDINLTDYAKTDDVYSKQEIDNLVGEMPPVPEKISDLENDAGYITLEDLPEGDNVNLSDYYTKQQIDEIISGLSGGVTASLENASVETDTDGNGIVVAGG